VFSPLDLILGLFSLDIGIDLGTANTLVSVRGKGIVINEPSFVALEKKTRRPIEVAARKKCGAKSEGYSVVRPLRMASSASLKSPRRAAYHQQSP
jgi:rod shape-determining protein MreB